MRPVPNSFKFPPKARKLIPHVYRGWLVVFVPFRAPPPPVAEFCSRDDYGTTFQISFIYLPELMDLTYKKMVDCHETKNQHIDWNLSLKCDHRIWPWPWPWPWIFKVKYGIRYILSKNGPIATKQKANISIQLQVSNVTIGFDLGCEFDFEFSNMKSAISRPKMVRLPRNKKQIYQLNSMPQMWPSDLTFTVTLTLNFHGQIWSLFYLSQKWFDCHKM